MVFFHNWGGVNQNMENSIFITVFFLKASLSLFWIVRLCPIAQLPLKTIIKLLMPGPIDKINRFRRCAIWHAQGHSECLDYMVHFVLNIKIRNNFPLFLVSSQCQIMLTLKRDRGFSLRSLQRRSTCLKRQSWL